MTTTFTVTRDEISAASLRLLGVTGQANSPTAADLTNCAQALNMIIKRCQTKGLPLWTYGTITVPLVVGTASYTIGPSGVVVTDRPLRVAHAILRNSDNIDTELLQISRHEYQQIANKTVEAQPNQFYFDPQMTNAVLYLYPTPDDASDTVRLTVHKQMDDVTTGAQIPSFPNEWFGYLKFALAAEVGPEYEADMKLVSYFEAKAEKYLEDLANWSQEEAPVFFSAGQW